MLDAPVQDLIARALPGRGVGSVARIGADRGVFSVVARVELVGEGEPSSVVVKLPDPGPNGAAAAAAGAYRREALAYRIALPTTPVGAPRCHLVHDDGDRASFVLEDLTGLRTVDQLAGLGRQDAAAVVDQLAALHRRWAGSADLAELPVRRATPATLDPGALARGATVLRDRWHGATGPGAVVALERLLAARADLVAAFAAAGADTLCHGDPRADNVAFTGAGGAVLFDWQQLAVGPAEADLAWLAATSLEPEVRRTLERDLVARHAAATGRDEASAWLRYRLGMVLPGLAVLLLAQRQLGSPRAEQLVATSLRRIAAAVDDLAVVELA